MSSQVSSFLIGITRHEQDYISVKNTSAIDEGKHPATSDTVVIGIYCRPRDTRETSTVEGVNKQFNHKYMYMYVL